MKQISTSKPDGSDGIICDELGRKRLEQGGQILQDQAAGFKFLSNADRCGLLYRIAASLYSFCDVKGLKVVCILVYCSKGDNTSEPCFVAESLHLLQQKQVGNSVYMQWRIQVKENPKFSQKKENKFTVYQLCRCEGVEAREVTRLPKRILSTRGRSESSKPGIPAAKTTRVCQLRFTERQRTGHTDIDQEN